MATTKILVADPEPMICELIGDVFMQVVAVGTAPEGLTALLTKSFALAIIEAMLPGGSGIGLAAVAADENIPVLLMSAHPDTNLSLHALGFPFIQKPFCAKSLVVKAVQVVAQGKENIRLVKAASARTQKPTTAHD